MNPVCNESPWPPNAMVYLVPDTLFLCSNPGGIRSPSDEAKRPREVGVGGLDLSFKREEEEEEMANSGKEEEEKLDEEVVRVGDDEGRETESDDGAPRPNGGNKKRCLISLQDLTSSIFRTKPPEASCSSVGEPRGLECGEGGGVGQ